MGELSAIAWTHATFNPWLGCTKVSPACTYCYAERDRAVAAASTRVGRPLWGPDAARVVTSDAYWKQPLKWNREAEAAGERRRVFCASLADVFEDRRDLDELRLRLWFLIEKTPHLDWLLLTKRPECVARLVWPSWVAPGAEAQGCGWPKNVWLGTTVENQEQAARRIPELVALPARVRVLSCEPLLGPLDLRQWLGDWESRARVSWVIVGGESGSHARPMHPAWALSLRDQCAGSLVPFFFKQWGEWRPCPDLSGGWEGKLRYGVRVVNRDDGNGRGAGELYMEHVGKKIAGNLLDGQLHEAFPRVARA